MKGDVSVGNKKIINVSDTIDIREIPEGKSYVHFPEERLRWLIKKAIDRESKDGYSFDKSFNVKIKGVYTLNENKEA